MRIFSNKAVSGKVCRRKLSEIIAVVPKHNRFRLQLLSKIAQLKQIFLEGGFKLKISN